MDYSNLLGDDSFDYDALNTINKLFHDNFESSNSNAFKEILFDLFEGDNFNTKTKKSILYQALEDKLTVIFSIVNETPKGLICFDYLLDPNNAQSEENLLKVQNAAMISGIIQGAIKIKIIARYKNLLPKRRFNDFKKKYPTLNNAFDMYKQYEANKKAKEDFIKVHNNNGISEVVKDLHLIKPVIKNNIKNLEFKLKTKNGIITIKNDKEEGETILNYAKRTAGIVGPKQQQLLVYIMSLIFEQKKPEDVKEGCCINIDLKEYCQLKNISFRKEAADDIISDLEKLSNIFIEYEYQTPKGKKQKLRKSPLLMHSGTIDKYNDADGKIYNNSSIGVFIGKWIETLSYEQYQFFRKGYFKYKITKDNGALPALSYYINCQHKNNFTKSKNGEFKIKVSNLTNKMNIEERRIKEKGYSATLKKPLENYLNQLKEVEGFNWKYKNGVHNSRKEFEEDIIIFNNKTLNTKYKLEGLTRKEAKKK